METAADSPDSRYPVRRSGRQAKRTDKLEEFLSSAKRASRKSNPLSLDGGEPPPTDVETASEASLDGNPDFKNDEDKVESPERRTRSSTRKQQQQQQQQQQKSQCGRQTRGGSRVMVKDEDSSENEEDDKDAATDDNKGDQKEEVKVGDTRTLQPQAEMDSSQSRGVEQNEHGNENDEEQMKMEAAKDTDPDGSDKTVGGLVKRGPLRTYVNKKKAATKNTTGVKAPANKSATANKRETRAKSPQGSKKAWTRQRCNDNDDDDDDDEEDEDDEDSSTSSSSESDTGYDPNALYCICRQKHNKRYFPNEYILQ